MIFPLNMPIRSVVACTPFVSNPAMPSHAAEDSAAEDSHRPSLSSGGDQKFHSAKGGSLGYLWIWLWVNTYKIHF